MPPLICLIVIAKFRKVFGLAKSVKLSLTSEGLQLTSNKKARTFDEMPGFFWL